MRRHLPAVAFWLGIAVLAVVLASSHLPFGSNPDPAVCHATGDSAIGGQDFTYPRDQNGRC